MNKNNISISSDRRKFIKASTAAATATVVAPNLLAAFKGGDDEIKIGIVGCGGRGTGALKQALSTPGKTKVWAISDAFLPKAQALHDGLANDRKFKEKVDAKDRIFDGFDGYKKVIDSGVDMVILTTSPGFRPTHFEYAVNAGKHVFMEKPVACDAHGVRKVLAAAQKATEKNLKVVVGLHRRYDVRYQEIIKRLQDGIIGDLITFRAYWNGSTPWTRPRKPGQTEMAYQMDNWYYFNWVCGDHINEQHIHNLDVCNWVMNDYPGIAQGQGGREVRKGKDQGQTFDHHNVEFVYGNKWNSGVRMFSACRHIRGCWNNVSESVHGAKGYAIISRGEIYNSDGEQIFKAERSPKHPQQVEHDVLFEHIRKDRPKNDAVYGAKSTMTAILGRMATYSGQLLKWDSALNSKIDDFNYDPNFKWSWDAEPPVLPDGNGAYPVPVPGKTKVI